MNKIIMRQLESLVKKNNELDKETTVTFMMDNASRITMSVTKVDPIFGIVAGHHDISGNWLYVIDASKVNGFFVDATNVPSAASKELIGVDIMGVE